MSEDMQIFVTGVVTGLASGLMGVVVQHLLTLRRDRILRQRDEQQRRKSQVEVTAVYREDETTQDDQEWNRNLKYLLLHFTIDNLGDSPKLLTQLRIRFVLRDARDLAYLLERIVTGEPISITDQFPYNGSFAGKICVRLLDANSHVVDLTTPIRIGSRDKLWVKVLFKTTDDWRQALRASKRLIRYLTFGFVIDDQPPEEIGVDVQNEWWTRSYNSGGYYPEYDYLGWGRKEVDRLIDSLGLRD